MGLPPDGCLRCGGCDRVLVFSMRQLTCASPPSDLRVQPDLICSCASAALNSRGSRISIADMKSGHQVLAPRHGESSRTPLLEVRLDLTDGPPKTYEIEHD